MNKTPQQLAQQLQSLIDEATVVVTGKVINRNGDRVQVKLDSYFKGSEYLRDGALAGPGAEIGSVVTCLKTDNGEWVALGSQVNSQKRNEQSLLRRSRNITSNDETKFWILVEANLYEMVVRGNTAIANRLCNAEDFPAPYNFFHEAEPGLCRISDTEFYLPRYSGIHKYNIATKTAETVVGTTGTATSGFSYTFSCCSLPDKTAFFALESYDNPREEYLLRINPDGTTDQSLPYTTDNLGGWSIAAVDRSTVYIVTDYGVCSKFNFETGEIVNLFQNENITDTTSLYGSIIDERVVQEVTYAYADPITKDCYAFGTIFDSEESVPNYNVVNAIVIGDAPETNEFGEPLKIVSGALPEHAVPGDSTGTIRIYRVINDNTFYAYASGNIYWEGQQTLFFDLRRRRFRNIIWKIQPDNTVSTYFVYPGTDTRETASGYRYHYNLPARGSIFDPKTKSIFMHGFRERAVQAGKYLGTRYAPQDKPLARLTKSKQFQPLLIKAGKNAPSDFNSSWFWFSQLEPIY